MTQLTVEEFIGKFISYYADELEKDVTTDAVVVNKITIKALRKMHENMTEDQPEVETCAPPVVVETEPFQQFTSKAGKKTTTNTSKGKMIAYINKFPNGVYKAEVVAKFENDFATKESCTCSLNATVKEGFVEMSSTKPYALYPIGGKAKEIVENFKPIEFFNGVSKK